jgi:hypothetical protein
VPLPPAQRSRQSRRFGQSRKKRNRAPVTDRKKLASILSQQTKKLLAMGRYVRRAVYRRKRAIRALDGGGAPFMIAIILQY